MNSRESANMKISIAGYAINRISDYSACHITPQLLNAHIPQLILEHIKQTGQARAIFSRKAGFLIIDSG